MTWHALYYPLQPGTDDTVAKLFADSGRPSFQVTDSEGAPVGRLLGTMAFVGPAKAFRVMEIDGALPAVAAHLSRQPAIRDFEQRLEDHLAEARDMRTPAGARAFFQAAAMNCVQEYLDGGIDTSTSWSGVFYPLLAGHEDAVRDLVVGDSSAGSIDTVVRDGDGAEIGRLTGTLMFVGRQKALRLVRADVPAGRLITHLSRQPAAREFQERIEPHLAVDRRGDGGPGMRRFFADAAVRCVLSRRHDVDI
jgi:hypothetical protein